MITLALGKMLMAAMVSHDGSEEDGDNAKYQFLSHAQVTDLIVK